MAMTGGELERGPNRIPDVAGSVSRHERVESMLRSAVRWEEGHDYDNDNSAVDGK